MRDAASIEMRLAKPARFSFALILVLGLLLGMALAPRPSTAEAQTVPTATPTPDCPPGEYWDPVMGRCWPIRRDCPAGLIDVTGDGSVCEALDPVAPPGACLAWPSAPGLPATGSVECALPLQAGGQLLRISGSVGCLNVSRRPYPRALVNLPVEYRVTGVIPPNQLSGIPFGDPGSYRLSSSDPWATEGLFLHERYGGVTSDSFGQPAFNTRALLVGDAYPYPSVNNVRARLVFKMATGAEALTWTTAGRPSPFYGGLTQWAETTYTWASYPLPGSLQHISSLGPALNGTNSLPAFKVAVQSRWDLYLNAEWDEYTVNDAHEYVWANHRQVEVRVAPAYVSYRVWDNRQQPVNAAAIYCNAANGYIPVPVIEAQTVLR